VRVASEGQVRRRYVVCGGGRMIGMTVGIELAERTS
jgi:hypothetical protein